ncbi:hypothetical protein HDU87_007572 [Geranomyces variabilis]|uniref:Uncharacterized protein n=1 Tax=Geranomyces variabilis TaxID=109894 RepID=A0AAD5XN79_9FUNG|nr:hypothetical protein HDU87_007572 [Geranomyces variabilis]
MAARASSSFILPTVGGLLAGATTYHLLQSRIHADTSDLQHAMLHTRRTLEQTLPVDKQDQSLFVPSSSSSSSSPYYTYASSTEEADTLARVLGYPIRVQGYHKKSLEVKNNWNRTLASVAAAVTGAW